MRSWLLVVMCGLVGFVGVLPRQAAAVSMFHAQQVCNEELADTIAHSDDSSFIHHYECQASPSFPNCYAVMGYVTQLDGSPWSGWGAYYDPASWAGESACYTPGESNCHAGDKYSKAFPGSHTEGESMCVGGCDWTFHGGPSNGGDGPGNKTCLGDICTTSGTFTNSGNSCTPPKPPPEICAGDGQDPTLCTTLPPDDKNYCVTTESGQKFCVKDDGGGGPPSICSGTNCVPVPPPNNTGGCSADSTSALCVGPTSPGPAPPSPPPLPPNPPISPSSPQPPPIIVIQTPVGPGGGGGPTGTSVQGSHCGGSGEPPCSTGPGTPPGGGPVGGPGGGGPGNGGPSTGTTCPDGSSSPDGWCPASCPPGAHLIGRVCSSGTATCTGNPNVVPNADGNCPPAPCGVGQTQGVDGSCHPSSCPSGQHLSSSLQCVANPTCDAPAIMGSDGACHNPGSGGGSTPPVTCAAGQVVVAGVCTTPPPDGTCPAPNVRVSGVCTAPNNGGGPPGPGTGGGGTPPPDQGCTAGNVCNDSASGGYDCNSAPSCSGDSVLCNIDFQSWVSHCPGDRLPGQEALDSALSALPTTADSVVKENDVDDLSSALDATGFMTGSGSCPQFDPLAFAYGGQSISINLNDSASWCLLIQAIGALMLALAYFRAYQILMRG